MAESIITLGIGATPTNLTPFITTGLFVGEAAAVATYTASVYANLSPSGNTKANLTPSGNVEANPSPSADVESG